MLMCVSSLFSRVYGVNSALVEAIDEWYCKVGHMTAEAIRLS